MLKVCCDFCDRPLTAISDENGTCVTLSRTKEFKTSKLFPHLCEVCADKIDMVLRSYKDSVTKDMVLTEQYAKLNEERKANINTKG